MTATVPVSAHRLSVDSTAPERGARMLSLDVFRGLMVSSMLLVTNPGSYDAVYWPLKHADWNGGTPTDMIFPSFLFAAGVSMTFSFAARRKRGATTIQLARHVIVRALLLILIGLFLNAFPLFDMHNLRIPGVLQLIGLCSLGGGLFYLGISRKNARPPGNAPALIAAITVLLIVYWGLLRFVPVPGYGAGRLDQAGNFGAYIDRAIFGTNHLWFWGGQTWDPEGLLSTLTATPNLMLGLLTGEWLRAERPGNFKKLVGLAATGLMMLAAGIALNPILPINKKIWTDSFMLFSGGFSLLALALLAWLIDTRGWRWGTTPALIFGSNAILAFSLANMLTPLEGMWHFHDASGGVQTVHSLVFHALSRWVGPFNASLGYAFLFVAANMAILYILYRKRLFLRL